MLDSPLVLLALGMSAVTAVVLAKRKRKPPTALSTLTNEELRALLLTPPTSADVEITHRLTVLVIEELERRRA